MRYHILTIAHNFIKFPWQVKELQLFQKWSTFLRQPVVYQTRPGTRQTDWVSLVIPTLSPISHDNINNVFSVSSHFANFLQYWIIICSFCFCYTHKNIITNFYWYINRLIKGNHVSKCFCGCFKIHMIENDRLETKKKFFL